MFRTEWRYICIWCQEDEFVIECVLLFCSGRVGSIVFAVYIYCTSLFSSLMCENNCGVGRTIWPRNINAISLKHDTNSHFITVWKCVFVLGNLIIEFGARYSKRLFSIYFYFCIKFHSVAMSASIEMFGTLKLYLFHIFPRKCTQQSMQYSYLEKEFLHHIWGVCVVFEICIKYRLTK